MVSKAILIIPIIVIAGIGAFFYIQLNPSQGPAAVLMIESGSVEYSTGGDFLSASDGMELKEGYTLRTGDGSRSSIVFRESSVVRLDENTEVMLSDFFVKGDNARVTIAQSSGRTWNQVLKMSGFDEYNVETPTAVATVRGTSFDSNADDGVWFVDHGTLSISVDGESFSVTNDQSLSVGEDGAQLGGPIDDSWITNNRQMDVQWIETTKQRLLDRYSFLLDTARKEGATDVQIQQYLEGYVRGDISVQDAVDQGIIPEQYLGLIPEELKRY